MEIIASALDWTQVDAERLAAFLDTDTGKRFLPKLVENAPPLFDGGDTNKILIRAGEVRGFQTLVREIISLAHPPPPGPSAPTNHYPALTDDAQWNDGQKIEPETEKPTIPDII